MGKLSRNKGAGFEREIVNILKDAGFDASRNLNQTRDGGHDIVIPGVKVAVECKRAAKPLMNSWWAQACEQAGDDLEPVLIYKLDRKPIRAMFRLSLIDQEHRGGHIIESDMETLIYLLRETIWK